MSENTKQSSNIHTRYDFTRSLKPSFSKKILSVYLFIEVDNAAELRERILKPTEEDVQILKGCLYVFVHPKPVISVTQIVHAMNRALFNDLTKQLKTKNLQTEFLFCLSSTNNITESLQLFGVQEGMKEILLVAVDASDEQIYYLKNCIHGSMAPISLLSEYTDYDLIKKHLRCTSEEVSLPGGLEGAQLARMATKGL